MEKMLNDLLRLNKKDEFWISEDGKCICGTAHASSIPKENQLRVPRPFYVSQSDGQIIITNLYQATKVINLIYVEDDDVPDSPPTPDEGDEDYEYATEDEDENSHYESLGFLGKLAYRIVQKRHQ